MPWKKDDNGERVYVPSVFAKEELPTWAEIYECYSKQIDFYGPRLLGHNTPDPYWRFSRRQYLIATLTNQLNKMLYEDGTDDPSFDPDDRYWTPMMNSAVDYIDDVFKDYIQNKAIKIHSIHFDCYAWGWDIDKGDIHKYDYPNTLFKIYTFPNPKSVPNPFIIDKGYTREDVSKYIHHPMFLHPVIVYVETDTPGMPIKECHIGRNVPPTDMLRWGLIGLMLSELKKYFEGEGVGWKDDDGHLIDGEQQPTKCSSGSDPAL